MLHVFLLGCQLDFYFNRAKVVWRNLKLFLWGKRFTNVLLIVLSICPVSLLPLSIRSTFFKERSEKVIKPPWNIPFNGHIRRECAERWTTCKGFRKNSPSSRTISRAWLVDVMNKTTTIVMERINVSRMMTLVMAITPSTSADFYVETIRSGKSKQFQLFIVERVYRDISQAHFARSFIFEHTQSQTDDRENTNDAAKLNLKNNPN